MELLGLLGLLGNRPLGLMRHRLLREMLLRKVLRHGLPMRGLLKRWRKLGLVL